MKWKELKSYLFLFSVRRVYIKSSKKEISRKHGISCERLQKFNIILCFCYLIEMLYYPVHMNVSKPLSMLIKLIGSVYTVVFFIHHSAYLNHS